MWSEVESAIRGVTDADVLLVFDCYHAGRLCRPLVRSATPSSHYDILGACSDNQVTPKGGDTSFTSSLIWALEELSKLKRSFTISQLRGKIMQGPNFPKDQIPALSPREDRDTYGEVYLSPIGAQRATGNITPVEGDRGKTSDRAYLDLRLYFDRDADKEHIGRTADAFKIFREDPKQDHLGLKRVELLGRYTTKEQLIIRFMDTLLDRVDRKKLSVVKQATAEAVSSVLGSEHDLGTVEDPPHTNDQTARVAQLVLGDQLPRDEGNRHLAPPSTSRPVSSIDGQHPESATTLQDEDTSRILPDTAEQTRPSHLKAMGREVRKMAMKLSCWHGTEEIAQSARAHEVDSDRQHHPVLKVERPQPSEASSLHGKE